MRYEDLQKARADYAAANKALDEQLKLRDAQATKIREQAQRSWHLGGNVVMHFNAPARIPPAGEAIGGIHFTANKAPGLMEEPEAPVFSGAILEEAAKYARFIEQWVRGEMSELPPSTFKWLDRKGFR